MKKELVAQINHYLANIAVSYIKMHNLHWNIIGTDFKSIHEYLEGIYDSYAEVLDEVAELLKIHEEFPLASLKDYLAVASIKELESKDISIPDALEITIADIEELKDEALSLRTHADEEGIFDLVAMLEEHIAAYSKNLWFLKATFK